MATSPLFNVTQDDLLGALRQEIEGLGSNPRFRLPERLDRRTAEEIQRVFDNEQIQREREQDVQTVVQSHMDRLGVTFDDVIEFAGAAPSDPDSLLSTVAGVAAAREGIRKGQPGGSSRRGRVSQGDINRQFLGVKSPRHLLRAVSDPAEQQVQAERVALINRFERGEDSLRRVADAVLRGDVSELSGTDLLLAAGPPGGLQPGLFDRDVLAQQLNAADLALPDTAPPDTAPSPPTSGLWDVINPNTGEVVARTQNPQAAIDAGFEVVAVDVGATGTTTTDGTDDTGTNPDLAALEARLAELQAELEELTAGPSPEEIRQQIEQAQAAREAEIRSLFSTVRGALGGTTIPFGGGETEVGPATVDILAGRAVGQPGSLLSAVGIRPPSAQTLANLGAGELAELQGLAEQAGIPFAEFERDITSAIPGRRRATRFTRTPNSPRLF